MIQFMAVGIFQVDASVSVSTYCCTNDCVVISRPSETRTSQESFLFMGQPRYKDLSYIKHNYQDSRLSHLPVCCRCKQPNFQSRIKLYIIILIMEQNLMNSVQTLWHFTQFTFVTLLLQCLPQALHGFGIENYQHLAL